MRRIVETPLVFTNEGMQLVGMVHRPEDVENPPAVVFFHGCTGSRYEAHWLFIKIARALAHAGIMALRFDFRYSGESEGEFVDMTLSGEVSDGIRAIDFVSTELGADPDRVGVLGMSFGGAVAAMTAGQIPAKIAALALMNPVGHPEQDILKVADKNGLDTTVFPVELNTFLFGEAFAADVINARPLEDIRAADCPVLVISATGDTSIDPARSREYIDAITEGGGNAEYFPVDGADHLFSSTVWEQKIIERLTSWFTETLSV